MNGPHKLSLFTHTNETIPGREHAILMLYKHTVIPVVLLSLFISSCGAKPSSPSAGASYNDTKTMVMDILKSDDGKKAVQAASQGGGGGGQGGAGGGQAQGNQSQIKLLSANDSTQLQSAVKDVLTADPNNKFLQEMMKDPKFAGDFAKAIQKDTKQLHKDLLKDPEYQNLMVSTMKNPEFEKMIMDTMKQSQYRQQMMSVIHESFQSPLFRTELLDLFKAAMKEQTTQPPKAASTGGADQKGGADKKSGGGKSSQGKSGAGK
jgi:spore germination protein D